MSISILQLHVIKSTIRGTDSFLSLMLPTKDIICSILLSLFFKGNSLLWQRYHFCLSLFTMYSMRSYFPQGYRTAQNPLPSLCHLTLPNVSSDSISPQLSSVPHPLHTVLGLTGTGSNGTKAVCLHCSLKIKYYLLLSSPGPAPNHQLLHSKDVWQWLG